MSDETTDPIAAIVREAMDYAADHGRITTPEDYADRIRETLATPAAGEDVRVRVIAELERTAEVWQSPHKGDANPLSDLLREAAALLRTPHDPDRQTTQWYCPEGCGCALDSRSARYHDCRTPSGEGEARVRVPEAMDRGCDCSGCYCGNSGDAESVGYADGWNACRAEMLAALRSEAPGEACRLCGHEWHRHDPADGRCDCSSDDARNGAVCPCGRDLSWMQHRIAGLSRDALEVRAARRGEGGGE